MIEENAMFYKNELTRINHQIRERIDDLKEELKALPEGELYVYTRDSVRHYYKRLPKVGNRKKERRIGIKKDPYTLTALTRKKYVLTSLEVLEKNVELIAGLISQYLPADENSVMGEFLEKYPELADGVYHGRKEIEDWGEWQPKAEIYHPENLKSTASDGSGRRSLGELLIGAKLDHNKISYRYEMPAHPDLPYIPDFTVMRPRDRKLIYWEHFGLINDKDYMERNRKKLLDYESVGIVPWENLIITYNQSDGGINERLIDAMIEAWLL